MVLPGDPVTSALENADTSQLLPSDGMASTLGFRNLQAGIMGALDLNVQAAEPEGLHGQFNSKTANVQPKPAVPGQEPGLRPDLMFMQQQNNNGFKPA